MFSIIKIASGGGNQRLIQSTARVISLASVSLFKTSSEGGVAAPADNNKNSTTKMVDKAELKKRLTEIQYHVTQEAGTERAFSGKYDKFYEKGVYICVVCHQELFLSDTKFDAGCGWPAFKDVVDQGKVTLHTDPSIPDRVRTEVRCKECNAHMGHVFDDGPLPLRKRYCINSAAIEFIEAGTTVKGTTSS